MITYCARRLPLLAFAGLLTACAAIKAPPGGPVDKEGPYVVAIQPASGTRNMALDQEIEIRFNEALDPVTVPASITVRPEIDLAIRVRGARVILRPLAGLPEEQAIVVTLHRGIQDYRRNPMVTPVQFVLATGNDIPAGRLEGRVDDVPEGKSVAVALFRMTAGETADTAIAVHEIELAEDGTFSFDYLTNGSYRVVALEGGFADFPRSIHRNFYGLSSTDSLVIVADTLAVDIRLSPPLAQPQLSAIDWITSTYIELLYDGPFGEAGPPDDLIPTRDKSTFRYILAEAPDDSLVIDIGTAVDQIGERYALTPLSVMVPELEDTTGPVLGVGGRQLQLTALREDAGGNILEVRGTFGFSEPVIIPDTLTALLTGRDSMAVPVVITGLMTAAINFESPDQFTQATIVIDSAITDLAGNPFADSLLALQIRFAPSQAVGQIRGRISGVDKPVVVEVLDNESGARIAWLVADSALYHFPEIPPGFYRVLAHCLIGNYPIPYYSGRWEPYRAAAKYQYYPQVIEVRPRWEVDGVDINFGADVVP